ncbi:MAG: hypothetical protein K0U41_03565 [Gammaproteobacteria bacterium]|nr:hypothetical protein [Gammaproteobacteria bacterium]
MLYVRAKIIGQSKSHNYKKPSHFEDRTPQPGDAIVVADKSEWDLKVAVVLDNVVHASTATEAPKGTIVDIVETSIYSDMLGRDALAALIKE